MTNDFFPALSTTEEDALALIRSATNISRARHSQDKMELTIALDENLQLWTAIQTLISKKEHPLPEETKNNLIQLSRFVICKTIQDGCEASQKTLDTLENLNLQIAEGLMENIRRSPLKEDAQALLQAAYALTEAAQKNNQPDLIAALDTNLHLWVGLKTLIQTKQLSMSPETAENIKQLADFTAQKTFELGCSRNDETLSTLININLQIAQGFLESRPLTPAEEDALALLRSALRIAEAKDNNDASGLVQALNDNLELWVNIRTLINSKNHLIGKEIKENLTRLADFTAHKTFEIGADTGHKTIDTLINVNLQISEGLLERIQFAA